MQDIIIMGANGRMGQTLVRFVNAEEGLNLAGVTERAGNEGGLERLGCKVSADADELFAQCPGATVIDFTAPKATMHMVSRAVKHGLCAVIGTTGLSADDFVTLEEAAREVPLFYAPNMSQGVNVLLKVLPQLVKLLGEGFDMEMVETHHKMKKDAPSGTAIKLAQCLAEARGWDYDEVKNYTRDGIIGERPGKEIGVQTLRGGDVVGEHTVYFYGMGERIEVTHRAHSRDMFAGGAVTAAKWLHGRKPGKLYNMQDIF
ncbi:MAG: 4-hydroxy-tetrahydrodipicolinate reductase [Desulfovibrionaceae bacterium]